MQGGSRKIKDWNQKAEMNANNMKVSIITVVYNGAATIEQTILSVLNQSYKNIEYIVIDGLSADGTQEIVRKYQDFIAYFVSEEDNGIYDAMNKGLRKATGDIIGIINSDDWYAYDAVESAVDYLTREKTDVVYGRWHNVYLDGTEGDIPKKPLEDIRYRMIIPHPTVFVKKDVYKKYGLFDLKYQLAADYDFLLKIYYEGASFGYMDRIIAYFREGGRSERNGIQASEEARTIAMKYLPMCSEEKSVLEKIEKKYRWDCFSESINDGDLLIRMLKEYFREEEFSLIIFGTGAWGKRCCEMLKGSKITISFFVDNSPSKWNQEFCDVRVSSPDKLKDMEAKLLVAVREDGDVIKEQLEELRNEKINYVTLQELADMFYSET